MGIQWSKEQKQVIDLRHRNILVSAAAGSGKTAVLVERIIQKITDPDQPVDIDKLLIVTFTNAAAAEMRERISVAIEKKMTEDPDNSNLQRQLTLVHNAQITTIDSFCLFVIRNYFHKIDLEPGFRVADEGEIALMKTDVMEELLEENYLEEKPDFLYFADHYSAAKNDNAIRDMILQMYQFSQSYPWPDRWLEGVEEAYQLTSEQDMEQTPWMQSLLIYLKSYISGLVEDMESCLLLTQDADGPGMYEPAVQSDVDQLLVLKHATTYGQYEKALNELNFARLSSARKYEGSVEKQDYVKDTRNIVKKAIQELKDQFFFLSQAELFDKMKRTRPMVSVLVELTQGFASKLAKKKRDKNIIDFNDMEHFALEVLVDKETGLPSDTAGEFQEHFEEIMIDEYQDSNYVQETILTAISKERKGENNIFMVGDVKQSIYRFRLARPELFMEKYDTYSLTDSDKQRIDLHRNYRSRKEIVDSVNDVFYSIMQKDLGNVTYDDQAALYQGAAFVEPEDKNLFQTEVLLVEKETQEENTGQDRYENEARVVAARIRELMRTQQVTDKDTGALRALRYSDIVILFRSLTGWADSFVEILSQEGIPAHTESKTGYFSTLEIQTVLNLLRVIDNPQQDIPLTAVLTSPVVGLKGEDLAKIRIAYPEAPFHQAIQLYGAEPTEGQEQKEDLKLMEKLQNFFKMVDVFRGKSAYLPIHELMEEILKVTGYEDYVSALPAGARKSANIRMLVEKAIAYEGTSYRGLFHFVRYIEKLQKYDVDFGEAELLGEADDTVRIMSIHKSKGLEFPVVFVSAMGKQFNKQDTRSRLILHPELGAGLDYVDGERRTKTPTLIKKVLARQTDLENLGEELRVLYVALTRAKEKLILTGTVKGASELLEDLRSERELFPVKKDMSFFKRTKASSYYDWVLPVLVQNQVRYHFQCVTPEEISRQEMTESVNYAFLQEQFQIRTKEVSKDSYETIEKRLSYRYPYEKEAGIKSKISVSELKHRAMEEVEEAPPTQWFSYEEEAVTIPAFMQENVTVNLGALRGSAFHRAMECMDFTRIYQSLSTEREEQILTSNPNEKPALTEKEKALVYQEVKKQLQERLTDGKIPQDMYDLIYLKNVAEFFETPLAMRMCQAAVKGTLKREKPFVMGIPAKEVDPECDSEELVLIQGIIDGFFQEEDQVIVMDYKTDGVEQEQILVSRYQEQLKLYSRALERITGKKVTQQILYSSKLKKEIIIGKE